MILIECILLILSVMIFIFGGFKLFEFLEEKSRKKYFSKIKEKDIKLEEIEKKPDYEEVEDVFDKGTTELILITKKGKKYKQIIEGRHFLIRPDLCPIKLSSIYECEQILKNSLSNLKKSYLFPNSKNPVKMIIIDDLREIKIGKTFENISKIKYTKIKE